MAEANGTASAGAITKPHRIDSLDGVRAVASFFVIMSHTLTVPGVPDWLQHRWPMSGFGVMLFLLLSGYVVTNQLLVWEAKAGEIPYLEFSLKRLFRQLPSVLLFVGACILLNLSEIISFSAKELLAALGFVRNLTDGSYYTQHLWSLGVQQQFFLVWPLILMLAPRNRRLEASVLLTLLQPLWSWCSTSVLELTTLLARPDLRAAPLLVGATIALAHSRHGVRKWLTVSGLSGMTGLLLGLGLLVLERTYLKQMNFPHAARVARLTMYLGMGLSVNHLVLAATSPATRFFASAPMVWIGRLTFQLYLWQQLFATNGNLSWQRFPLNLVLIFLISATVHFLIEQPLTAPGNRWASSLARRKKSTSPSSSEAREPAAPAAVLSDK